MVDVVGRAKVIVSGEVDPASVTKSGTTVGNLLGGALKKTAIATGAAVGTVLGTAIAKGFSRLSAIEEAQAKLAGLGNSAKTVSTVMDNALASVKGTAFGLGDAASIAASAVASGVKPGQDLERTLRLVADASTIAGTDLGEMGAIFNKVAATNKVQGEVLNQLGERGIPIIQLLGKTLGKTSEEVIELASDGKIGFADFQKAIEEGMGGAALKSGQTFRGALANAGAALGRFGAALIGPAFAAGPALFGNIITKLDEFTPAAERLGTAIAANVGPAFDAVREGASKVGDILAGLGPSFDRIGAALTVIGPVAQTAGIAFAQLVGATVLIGLQLLVTTIDLITGSLAAMFGILTEHQTAFTVLASVAAVVFAPLIVQTTIATAQMVLFNAQVAISIVRMTLQQTVTALVSAATAVYNATLLGSVVGLVRQAAGFVASTAAIVAHNAVLVVVTAATKAWTIAQRALNIMLSLNPIGLVVIAVAALVAGLILAYQRSETFRKIVQKAGKVGQQAFGWVVDKAKDLWGWIQKVIDKVQGLIDKIKNSPLGAGIGATLNIFDGDLDIFNASGTRNWRGGWSVVGEQGPELVNLPRGTDIYSNGESQQMGGGGFTYAPVFSGPVTTAAQLAELDWVRKYGSRFGRAV